MATKLEKVDAVTVGDGWAGGIVAAELAKKGFNVVGLEKEKMIIKLKISKVNMMN